MLSFIVIAVLAVLLVLALLFRPFLFKNKLKGASRTQLNTAIYKEELDKLESDLAAQVITQDEYAVAHAEIKQRLLQESEEEGVELQLRSPIKTMLAIGVFIPVLAASMYYLIGSPADLNNDGTRLSPAQIEVNQMVEKLAKRMEENPNDLKGWAMLARSYKVLRRPLDAEKAFDRAGSYLDGNAQLLADYADVVATNAGGNFDSKATQILERALKADPNHLMSLWLAGTAAYNRQDASAAIRYWEHLLQLLPADSDDARMIRDSLIDVRSKANMPPKNYDKVGRQPSASASQASVSGSVDVDASVKSKAKPEDIVMVIARPVNSRMPVAVKRAKVSELPLNFVLDDSMAMAPEARISLLTEVTLEARVSKSGQAKPESGDLMSATQTVKVGTKGIQLQVNQVRP